jgi:hypothetical protein
VRSPGKQLLAVSAFSRDASAVRNRRQAVPAPWTRELGLRLALVPSVKQLFAHRVANEQLTLDAVTFQTVPF